jgi:hypothetical protein
MKLVRLFPMVLLACVSARPIESAAPSAPSAPSAPVVAVEPRTVPPVEIDAAPTDPPTDAMPSSCERGFVEVLDGGEVIRYELGRESVVGTRGATHAFAELVIHKPHAIVFHLEGIAKPDSLDGHFSISVNAFHEPTTFPAVFSMGQLLHRRAGRTADRGYDHGWTRIELTSFGEVGGWVTGTFSTTAESGRFQVCRTADWRVRI